MAEAGKQTKGKKLTFLAMHQVNFHFIPFKKVGASLEWLYII